MSMDRRKAIKNIAIVSGGLITLPQWMVSYAVMRCWCSKSWIQLQ